MLDTLAGWTAGLLTTVLVLAVTADPNLVLNVLALASVLGVAFAIFRSGGFGVVRQANEELRRYKEEADEKIRVLTAHVGLLETKTSLEPMVASVIVQFEGHEERAQERHEVMLASQQEIAAQHGRSTKATLALLDMIANRLGPEPNHE